MKRCVIESTVVGHSAQAMHSGEPREPEMFRIAGHDLARSLAGLKNRRRMRQRPPARFQQRRRSVGTVRRLEHPSRKRRVIERERDVRVGEAFQPCVETPIRIGDCSAQFDAQPLEASLRQGVEQGAPVGEVTLRGRVTGKMTLRYVWLTPSSRPSSRSARPSTPRASTSASAACSSASRSLP